MQWLQWLEELVLEGIQVVVKEEILQDQFLFPQLRWSQSII
jgi:hypothetical protein